MNPDAGARAGTPADRPWRAAATPALAVLAFVAAAVLVLWPTAHSLHASWTDTFKLSYTHGYIVAALSVWLLARAARDFDTAAPDWRLALLLAAGSLCWLVAYRAGIELLHQLMFPALTFVALAAAFGLPNARRAWFAFAYLYFALTIWDVVSGPLQILSVVAARFMLVLAGVPVFVEGTVLHIPEGSFTVDPGCSGQHFFIVALALAVVFGEIHRDSIKVRVRLVLLAAMLALLSNWIRIFCVVYAGHLTEMQHYLVRVEHYTFGWIVFAVAMALFFWRASRAPISAQPVRTPAVAGAGVGTRTALTGAIAALAALAIGPVLGALAQSRALPAARTAPLPALAGWAGPAQFDGGWEPLYPHSDRHERGEYIRDGRAVAVFTAQFDEQHQGKELVGYGNSLFNGLSAVEDGGMRATSRGAARRARVRDAAGVESVLVYYYRIDERHRVRGITAQLTYGLASMIRPVHSSVVAALAACSSDCDAAAESAGSLLDALDVAEEVQP